MEPKPELQGPMPAAYHVFINHRGPDVKNSLASLIYVWLTKYHNLRVFLDKNEIRTGDTISDTIRYAIQSASVNIAIFSQRYAESTWCLDELLWMLSSHHERHRKVIPVFYDVKPTDLRHIDNGCYKNAFEDHQRKGRVSNEKMEKWRNALNEASNLSGIEFKTEESDQGELLDKIVCIVLEEVFQWGPLEVAKYPVGLEQAAEDFPFNEIQKQSELNTMIVGIVGMSGSGKSTLAKYLYNLRRPNFNGRSCFLSEVRKKDLPSLQGKLLCDLLGYNQGLHIDQGKLILRHCRILLVLDDVDHIDQIDGLLDMDSVGCGSLILITSRDKDLLRRSSPKIVLYDVKPLSRQHARELFCQHAFRQSKPSQEFDDLVEDFLEICKGLPLSLKVLGGQLLGFSDREHWKRQFAMFSTTLHNDIIKTLKVGYDALDDALDKEAFLDVGCFLMGEETELAIRVLNGLYGSNIVHSLERLHQKCLLDFHYDVQWNDEIECRKQENRNIGYNDLSLQYRGYKLTMHDQLRELARHIAREQFRVFPNQHNPLRLSSDDDIVQLRRQFRHQDKSNTPSIWGIRNTKEKPLDFSLQDIRGERVRLLVLEFPKEFRPIYSGDLVSLEISGDLVWLRLRNVWFDSMRFLLSTSVRSLTVLELESYGESIEEFFKILMDQFMGNPDKAPSRLNELNINILNEPLLTASSSRSTFDAGPSKKSSESYISSPVQQGGVTPTYLLSFLKWIGLENLCKIVLTNLTSLPSLPVDFGDLPSLRHLDLSGCTNLNELPNSFSKLMQLQHLALRECKNLSIPLEILGEISTLEYVDFEGCDKLVALPQGIPHQRHLRYLNLLFTRLSELPENLERLGNLEQLRIGSPELRRLPLSVANLKGLTELIVIQCRHLQCLLPEGISAPNIKILTVDSCPIANFSFEKDQGTMGVLRDLNLKNTSICEICMVDGVFPWLQTIDLSENIMLKQVIALPSALVRINLGNCWELKTLKNLSNLVNLKFLNINGCFELETLSVEGLVSLEEIEAEKCWKLERIEGLSSLKRLKCLKIATDNEAFWADICTLSTHELSNFIFAGKVGEGGTDRLISNLNSGFYPNIKRMYFDRPEKIDKLHSHNAALLLYIISYGVGRRSFSLNFYTKYLLAGRRKSHGEDISYGEERGGEPRVYVFMYSKLFRDLRLFSDVDECAIEDSRPIPVQSSSRPIPVPFPSIRPIPVQSSDSRPIPVRFPSIRPIPVPFPSIRPISVQSSDSRPIPVQSSSRPIPVQSDSRPIPVPSDSRPVVRFPSDSRPFVRFPSSRLIPVRFPSMRPISVHASDSRPVVRFPSSRPIPVQSSDSRLIPVQSSDSRPVVQSSDSRPVEVWFEMVDKKTDVLKVWKEIITNGAVRWDDGAGSSRAV